MSSVVPVFFERHKNEYCWPLVSPQIGGWIAVRRSRMIMPCPCSALPCSRRCAGSDIRNAVGLECPTLIFESRNETNGKRKSYGIVCVRGCEPRWGIVRINLDISSNGRGERNGRNLQ